MKRSAEIQYQNQNCYDAALDRIRTCYDRFDHVLVKFSGGKDSTACLNLTIQVARELGKLPVRTVFWDEECIPPETVEYMARVAARPEVALEWYCVPCEQRNACSTSSPIWYPWAPEDRDRWARPLPDRAITQWNYNKLRTSIAEMSTELTPASLGSYCQIMGIRTQESLTRLRAIITKKDCDLAFISPDEFSQSSQKAYPIYDWKTEDVWLAPHLFGWDYNRAYDIMDQAGVSLADQRCSPAFGEQPLRKLWCFPICWPDLWHKMCERVPGVNTAVRYANSELYGFGNMNDGSITSWSEKIRIELLKWPESERKELAQAIRQLVGQHGHYTADPLPEIEPHPVSGFCWREIAKLAIIGNKLKRQQQKVDIKARKRRIKNEVANVSHR
jgi:predicted phosphoadenosine phosphosulfate sulfurtransferase